MNKRFLTGIYIFIAAWAFGIVETGYFGWNLLPKSVAEAICDAISSIGSLYGVFIIVKYYTVWIIQTTTEDVMDLLFKNKEND